MTSDTMTLFFALLATLAQVAVVAAIVLGVGARLSATVASFRDQVVAVVAPQAMGLAAVVALVATAGSLYLSEVADLQPCRLCWFQRIAMYPLVVVLGAGALRRDAGARLPGAILAMIGAGISIWHLLIERYPTLESGSCDPNNPCSVKWVTELGYLTIPGMALSGFVLILALIGISRLQPKESQ